MQRQERQKYCSGSANRIDSRIHRFCIAVGTCLVYPEWADIAILLFKRMFGLVYASTEPRSGRIRIVWNMKQFRIMKCETLVDLHKVVM